MKNVLAVGVLMTLALSACGYPQMYKIYNYPETDAEETYTPIKRQYYMPRIADGIFDEHTNVDSSSHEEPTDVGTQDYNIETNPYIHSYFYEMMRKLQEALNRIHQKTLESGPDVDNDEFGFGHVNSEYPIFDLSNAKNTTTSETKVIDGQIVTVNETLINNADDENGGTVIRIKTIQVKPSEKSPTEEDETTTPVEDIENHTIETDSPEINEPVAKRNDESNDIPNGGIDDQERFSEWGSMVKEANNKGDLDDVETLNNIEIIEPHDYKPGQYVDLSGDTKVNDYLSDQEQSQGLVAINPDSEFIDINEKNQKKNGYYNYVTNEKLTEY